ncbi:hypothetical protein C4L14_18030 [Enterobacter sp. RC4]|nr:hypothetical protein C4L14_18030 [Enterobacter sp. RC4]
MYDGVFEVLQWLLFLSAVPPKGVFITDLKLKAFRNPQPSWGFSVHKKIKKGRKSGPFTGKLR